MCHRPQQRQALLQKIQQKAHDDALYADLGERVLVCLGATGGGVRAA